MLFIPKKINIGYQERSGTYSGKLAYIIYYDDKGVLRKETSWQNWRHKNIDNDELDNVPMEGFVLNKTAGGGNYGWNPRQTYTRVYDPRGFEFEITIPNLLYILENTNSIKGKGLEGEFLYGWDGTELTLIPVGAPDYKKIKEYSDSLYGIEYIKPKELIEGKVYKFKDGELATYMGKYNLFNCYSQSISKKKFIFHYYEGSYFFDYSSISGKIVDMANEGIVDNKYHEYASKLNTNDYISAYGTPDLILLDYDRFERYVQECTTYQWQRYETLKYTSSSGKVCNFYRNKSNLCKLSDGYYHGGNVEDFKLTIKEVYDNIQPHVFKYYTDKSKTETIEVGYGV